MLNEDNKIKLINNEKNPFEIYGLSSKGSFACRRPVGEGYYSKATNNTYVAWNEKGMDIYMAVYNHNTNKWSEPEFVWENNMFGRWDYHNYVTMIEGIDNEPIFFYVSHSNEMYQIKRNENGEWERKVICDDLTAYPSPIRYKDIIYIFYSRNTEISYPYRTLNMIKSYDNGDTWSDSKVVIDSEKQMEYKFDEVYQCGCEFVKATKKFPDRIMISWTMWGGPKGHATEGKGSYYAQLHLNDEKIYDAEGSLIGDYVDYKALVNSCFIEESRCEESAYTTFGPVVAPDDIGNAVVVYGIVKDGYYYLKEAQKYKSKWHITVIEKDIYNVEDIYRNDDSIDIAVCRGDTIVIYNRCDLSREWKKTSVTRINHKNNSNSFPYCNFIDKGKAEVKLILGQINKEDINNFYNGIWQVNILGENKEKGY